MVVGSDLSSADLQLVTELPSPGGGNFNDYEERDVVVICFSEGS